MRFPVCSAALLVLVAGCATKTTPTPAPTPAGGGRGGAPAVDPIRYTRTAPPSDPMVQQIWNEGMQRSQVADLAQVLLDSIGPRLINSDRDAAGQQWLIKKYAEWGVTARQEKFGTWASWQRGATHVDLVSPRVRTLEATMLAWSPGTNGAWIEGEVFLLPANNSPETIATWMTAAKGKFVLTPAPGISGPGAPNVSCRAPAQLQEFGVTGQWSADSAARIQMAAAYRARLPQGPDTTANGRREYSFLWPKTAGVAGILSTYYSNYPGTDKIFGNPRQQVPTIDLTCEDWNLLYRMADKGQKPRIRVFADSRALGEQPVFNVIAEIKGSEKPNEYIILSAHWDSWDAGSGATDNGTGTLAMMEAIRILKKVYPNPRRTIIVGHWNGEEQGLLGSRAFVADHPAIVEGVHFGMNQDNGTGRIQGVGPGPNLLATEKIVHYLGEMPAAATKELRIGPVGPPGTGGSDHSSFQCAKAPIIGVGGVGWDYGNLTWHTNRDTYDKIVMPDLRYNASLIALLTYEADRDPVFLAHTVLDSTTNAQTKVKTAISYTCPKAPRLTSEGR